MYFFEGNNECIPAFGARSGDLNFSQGDVDGFTTAPIASHPPCFECSCKYCDGKPQNKSWQKVQDSKADTPCLPRNGLLNANKFIDPGTFRFEWSYYFSDPPPLK